jgi:hypothetical protein
MRDKSLKFAIDIANCIRGAIKSDGGILIHFLGDKIITHNDGITKQIALNYSAIYPLENTL